MKIALLSVGCLFAAFPTLYAQQQPLTINPCGTYEHMERLGKLPEHQQYVLDAEKIRAQEGTLVAPKGVVYKIPIVFHILHDGGESNISREQVLDGLRILNEDYRMLNPDINTVAPVFAGMQADIEIEFVLATKAPNGECFAGITRTYNPEAANDGNMDQVTAIRNGNDIYNGNWPGNKYLNVFVVGSLSEPGSSLITLGYTSYPSSNTNMNNGYHVIHQCIGSIGTGGIYDDATSTHEIGHWLNLPHTWGSSNEPNLASNCNMDDGVDDTPLCRGIQGGSCNPNNPNPLNSCNGDNAFWGFDIQDNTENYMDYAHCSRMFTEGQKARMRAALLSSVGGRNNLWTTQNLIETGADGNTYLCDANFEADKTAICPGEVIQFTDVSYNEVVQWNWTFAGGTPATSTDQNPTVTYTTPGLYEVVLSATDGTITDVETKTAFIRVLPSSEQLPFLETFEDFTTLSNIVEWEVVNENGNAFELATNAGQASNQSAKIVNHGQTEGYLDELVATPLDLANVNQVTLSFRYAYKRRNTNDDDYLRVRFTKDCGETWATRKTLHGLTLSSAVQSSSYTPSAQSDWKTVHMTNITSDYFVDNFRYKFSFESGGGNNLFLDNINVYEGAPSDNLVVSINEAQLISELQVYPNPVEDELNVEFSLNNAQSAIIEIQDLTGKTMQKHLIHANSGANLVFIDTKYLASGMYFVHFETAGIVQTVQFVVK